MRESKRPPFIQYASVLALKWIISPARTVVHRSVLRIDTPGTVESRPIFRATVLPFVCSWKQFKSDVERALPGTEDPRINNCRMIPTFSCHCFGTVLSSKQCKLDSRALHSQ